MAYIIINGVSSKLIDGLLIQSLPPITKPKQRTRIEEIDGRDGDIITSLGFSAYDKPVLIGLYGDYNVDDVIKYFSTSGKITFSNELDKYYNFVVYDAIDFNKLIRFKTATVNIHVQPFKYSVEERPILVNNTASATILEIPVRNTGNIYSRPTLTVTGAGVITVYINNVQVFNINAGTGKTVILDAVSMNATDASGNFYNRQVIGDLNNFVFPTGNNILRVTGNVTSVKLETYSRWQ
jgi:phage-related protein